MSDTEQRPVRRGGLGRGLAALIPQEAQGAALIDVPLSAVAPNPRQPRGVFDEEDLEGLAASIADMGLLQPIVVRALGDERYELIAGERRLRASKMAGLTKVPAIVRETDDDDLLKEALVENIHRVQLNPLEEAAAFSQLLDDFGVTQEELAKRLGKSRPAISNALRLLSLPPAVQRKVAAGILTAGHAKAILALQDRGAQERLADRIVTEGLSVLATEEHVRLQMMDDEAASSPGASAGGGSRSSGGGGGGGSRRNLTAPGLVELQENLSDALMARVRISMGARTGKLTVEFGSVDDLERIVGVIARGLQTDIELDA
jgi:ParB family transcriptional regulator, chromosome partitioning protein